MTERQLSSEIETLILSLVTERGDGKTICPSDVARKLDAENWRDLMKLVRTAAVELAHQSKIRIMQKGKTVDPDSFRGPIRLSLPESEQT